MKIANERTVYLKVFVRQVELKVQRVHSLREGSGDQLLQRVLILTQLGQRIIYQDHFTPHTLNQHKPVNNETENNMKNTIFYSVAVRVQVCVPAL